MKITDHTGKITFDALQSKELSSRMKEIKAAYEEARKAYRKDKAGEKPTKPKISVVATAKDVKHAQEVITKLRQKQFEEEQKKKE